MAQFDEVRDTSNILIKLKAKLTGKKREINVTKAGDYVYLHVNNLDGAYKSGKFTMKDAKSVTMNMEDVYLLKGLLTGIEGKVDEMLVSSFYFSLFFLESSFAKQIAYLTLEDSIKTLYCPEKMALAFSRVKQRERRICLVKSIMDQNIRTLRN